jgi:hypothetical protein
MIDKLLRQPDRTKRQRDNLFDMPFFREREFAAASTQIYQQHFGWWRTHV